MRQATFHAPDRHNTVPRRHSLKYQMGNTKCCMLLSKQQHGVLDAVRSRHVSEDSTYNVGSDSYAPLSSTHHGRLTQGLSLHNIRPKHGISC